MTGEHIDKPDMDEPPGEPGAATPEGYTVEEPAVAELGEPGTSGAGMTPDVPHAADADLVQHGDGSVDPVAGAAGARGVALDDAVAHHDAVTHTDAHTTLSDDDHGHAEEALGPIDWGKWSYAIAGAIGGLIVIVFFFVALGSTLT